VHRALTAPRHTIRRRHSRLLGARRHAPHTCRTRAAHTERGEPRGPRHTHTTRHLTRPRRHDTSHNAIHPPLSLCLPGLERVEPCIPIDPRRDLHSINHLTRLSPAYRLQPVHTQPAHTQSAQSDRKRTHHGTHTRRLPQSFERAEHRHTHPSPPPLPSLLRPSTPSTSTILSLRPTIGALTGDRWHEPYRQATS
jgi:hypothetical protein